MSEVGHRKAEINILPRLNCSLIDLGKEPCYIFILVIQERSPESFTKDKTLKRGKKEETKRRICVGQSGGTKNEGNIRYIP